MYYASVRSDKIFILDYNYNILINLIKRFFNFITFINLINLIFLFLNIIIFSEMLYLARHNICVVCAVICAVVCVVECG